MSARALSAYEDWRARFRAGRPCPGLAALQRGGLLAALRAACPAPPPRRTPARGPARPGGEHEAALVCAVAALLRRLPAADQPPTNKENCS